jgi:hypothetical protein
MGGIIVSVLVYGINFNLNLFLVMIPMSIIVAFGMTGPKPEGKGLNQIVLEQVLADQKKRETSDNPELNRGKNE